MFVNAMEKKTVVKALFLKLNPALLSNEFILKRTIIDIELFVSISSLHNSNIIRTKNVGSGLSSS
jgi:hypothetical protein